jgi:hypothetical protein
LHLRLRGELADRRPSRLHRDRASRRVPSEQRSLRPLQYLDALDVEQGSVEPELVADIDVVDIHRDAGIEALRVGVRVDAAQTDAVGEVSAARVDPDEIRDQAVDVGYLARALLHQIIRGEHADGLRHVLHVLERAARGDDDFLQLDALTDALGRRLRCRLRRCRRCRQQQQSCNDAGAQIAGFRAKFASHAIPPCRMIVFRR